VAGFLAMLFFIPIDSTQVKVHLPVGSQIDRFAIALMVFAWIWFGGDQRAFLRTRRSKLFVGAAFVYFSLAVASVLLDNGRIINLGQLTLAEKRFALLASFMILSWFTLSALRYEDVRGFTTYLIGLGSITAVGIIIERRTGYNVFYNFSGVLLKPIASVASSPTVIHPAFGSDGRVVVVGPTLHGLAAATMMVVVFPFAFVRLLDAPSRRSWWLNALACMLLFAAAMSTEKKTALLVPIAAVIYVAIYRRRQIMRLAVPGVLVLVVVVHLASPHSLGILTNISGDASSNSTAHRLGDFSDLAPDIDAHPVFGRGFGTIDPDQPDQYRINDNEYLDELWEVGAAGLLAYIGMILAPVILARRAIRTGERERASLALAGSAGCVAFLVVSALFDALSYPQAPYMFFLVAALTTIAAAGPEGNIVPSRRLKLSRAIDPGL
jgi:O-antigen ligase